MSSAPEKAGGDLGVIAPHGGTLVDRILVGEAREEAIARARDLPKVVLNARAMSDLDLLAVGALSPLDGFMGEADYRRVLNEMRLSNGLPWTLPITLAANPEDVAGLKEGSPVALISPWEDLLGILSLEEKYIYDRREEARLVYRTEDFAHPGVAYLMGRGEILLGGPIALVNRPPLAGFEEYRLDPAQTRAMFQERGLKCSDGCAGFSFRRSKCRRAALWTASGRRA